MSEALLPARRNGTLSRPGSHAPAPLAGHTNNSPHRARPPG
jgi:hypothetical protein